MSVNFDNAQFRVFTAFAQEAHEANDDKAVARSGEQIDATNPLAGRSISATKADRAFAFIRKGVNKRANDVVRELFKQSIINMFGGESRIPANVKDAMLFKDYGLGKPLTARRILAVKAEVDKVKASYDEALAAANTKARNYLSLTGNDKANLDPEELRNRLENVDNLVKTAVSAACVDKDVLKVVLDSIGKLLKGSDGRLRTAESIKARVEQLVDNMAEVRAAARGNAGYVRAGAHFLASLEGKPVAKGVITGLIKSMARADVSAIRKLNANSSGPAINKAVSSLTNIINESLVSSGADKLLEGADEKVAAYNFIAALTVAKCGDKAAAKIQQCLNSENARKLMAVYDLAGDQRFDTEGMSDGHVAQVSCVAELAAKRLDMLKISVDVNRGIPENEAKPIECYRGQFDLTEFSGGTIFKDLTVQAAREGEAACRDFVDAHIQGNTPAADAMRSIFEKKVGPIAYRPKNMLDNYIGPNVNAMMNWNICSDVKKFVTGNQTQTLFAKDLVRQLNVKLPGGKSLSNDVAKALDELASFITKGAKTTFASLEKKEQQKVYIVASMLSQETSKAAQDGQSIAFSPENNTPAFNIQSDNDADTREFSLAFTESGSIELKFTTTLNPTMIMTKEKDHFVRPGNTINVDMEFELNADELDRMAELDFTKFDDGEALKIFNTSNAGNLCTETQNALPEEFQFKEKAVSSSAFIKFNLDN